MSVGSQLNCASIEITRALKTTLYDTAARDALPYGNTSPDQTKKGVMIWNTDLQSGAGAWEFYDGVEWTEVTVVA